MKRYWKKALDKYHNCSAKLLLEEAFVEIIKNATQQTLDILVGLGQNKDSFRKLGLTFEGKAFYDILTHPYNKHNFEYGEDKNIEGVIIHWQV